MNTNLIGFDKESHPSLRSKMNSELLLKVFLFKAILFLSFFFYGCNTDTNKVDLSFPPQLLTLATSDPNFYALYFASREIDTDLTSNCGVASPATAATGTTGTTTPTGTTTGTGTSTTSTRFSIINSYVMKTTKETMNLKFVYDSTQTRGSVDQQQGFTITGGPYNTTITGRQGTVTWGLAGTGLGYIDESNTGAQQLSFMKGVKVSLNGTFSRDTTVSAVPPTTCNTSDNVNCTTLATTTQCFTQDNRTCLVSTASGVPITIDITINCESKTVIPN